jgi:hypothetical protein
MRNDEREIGGYFQIELPAKKELYGDAIKLNSARNCLKYIILAQKPTKLYMPYYMQEGMMEESIRDMIEFEFYNINERFELDRALDVKAGEKILYNNYFASKDRYIEELAEKYGNALIIDNTHSFYSQPLPGIDTLYSLGSKYFGVPGGGYLYTDHTCEVDFEHDYAHAKVGHMLGRTEKPATEFFDVFQQSMKGRRNQPIKHMSKLAQTMMASIDYESIKMIRERNFFYLHAYLRDYNELVTLDFSQTEGPMVYPFFIKNESLRQDLISRKIYVPTFWKEIIFLEGASNFEKDIAKYLLPLPIDQRYGIKEMKIIVDTILESIK